MNEELIGAVVVAAVIIAGAAGVYLVFSKPTGQAFHTGIQECMCKMNGNWEAVLYSDGYVLTSNEQMRNVGMIDVEDKCPVVCASIGGHIDRKV